MTQNIHQKCAYVKPSMKVYPLTHRQHLLVGSLPVDRNNPSPYQW